MRFLILLLVIPAITSCDSDPKTSSQPRAFKSENPCDNANKKLKTFEFETFEIDVPCDWTLDTLRGIDTMVDVLRTNLGEVIHWDFAQGFNSNSNQDQEKVLSIDLLDSMLANYRDTSRYVFVDKGPNDINQEDYYRLNDRYVTIDGVRAKITRPKEHGKGHTIINFEISGELPVKDLGLYIVGFNLSQQTDSLLLKAFETIRFKRE